jgi:ML-like domain
MRFSLPTRTQNAFRPSVSSIFIILSILSLSFIQSVAAIRQIGSKSLATCMDNSGIGATTFDVLFTPDNSSFAFNINGVSTISGNVTGIDLPELD